ncbi:MAG: hybrid sensor histidine kinase/response regulator [Nocardioides sp.]|nr:hybrid sensor histidine kinase/response regulator [Nocardioides sp.]
MTTASGGQDVLMATRAHRTVVVDDTPDLRELLALAFGRTEDFEVVGQAADGREAIDVVTSLLPDVILIDLAMPVMDGLEALPHLRALCPEAVIVVLSGFQGGAMSQQALRAGADDYIEKGTSIRQVLHRVRDLVATRTGPLAPREHDETPQATPAAGEPAASVEETAEALERLRRAVAATAHEIRTPVTVLLGVTEALLDGGLAGSPERRERLLRSLARHATLLDTLTGDLLAAAQGRRGLLGVAQEPVDLAAQVTESLQGSPDILVEVPAEAWVLGEPHRLEQLLTNLVGNARKHGGAPIVVRIHEGLEDGQVRTVLEVEDHGPGVPEEFVPELFDEYTRGPGTTARGIGLGLYVVRQLAEAHGGHVDYRPADHGGAVFRVTLPAAARTGGSQA